MWFGPQYALGWYRRSLVPVGSRTVTLLAVCVSLGGGSDSILCLSAWHYSLPSEAISSEAVVN